VSSGEAQRVGQGSTIRFGIVRNVQQVSLQSNAPAGAVVGGTIGLIAGGRRPARNALLGAAAGGAVTAAAQGNRTGFSYTWS
jgi:outer membrane lipoprotein SlyB